MEFFLCHPKELCPIHSRQYPMPFLKAFSLVIPKLIEKYYIKQNAHKSKEKFRDVKRSSISKYVPITSVSSIYYYLKYRKNTTNHIAKYSPEGPSLRALSSPDVYDLRRIFENCNNAFYIP